MAAEQAAACRLDPSQRESVSERATIDAELLTWAGPGLGGGRGGTVRALAAYEARLAALEVDVAEAEVPFCATVPASEIGAAAMRAAVRRYVERPGGRAGDGEALLGQKLAN